MNMRLGHLAIRAKDIEATAKFYREVIGFKEAFRMNHLEGGRLGDCVKSPARQQKIC
ncbi:MAG: VOC family protein [Treponema sp.]|jgi:catechol 2,3-dioxygenase-like lactoylglutathione lyase family enzyme|nr:VOC family protein [Treponema sp.]